MSATDDGRRDWVGPVLQSGSVATAVVRALTQSNPGLTVIHRGAYVRVLCPSRCTLDRRAVEDLLGAPFYLPGDLERIMPAFRGMLRLDANEAVWEPYARGGPRGGAT